MWRYIISYWIMHNFYQPLMVDTKNVKEKYLVHTDVYHLYYGQRLEFKQSVINNRDSAKMIFTEMMHYEYHTNTSIRNISIDSFYVNKDSLYYRAYTDTLESIKTRKIKRETSL